MTTEKWFSERFTQATVNFLTEPSTKSVFTTEPSQILKYLRSTAQQNNITSE
jgi:hypothetical protein